MAEPGSLWECVLIQAAKEKEQKRLLAIAMVMAGLDDLTDYLTQLEEHAAAQNIRMAHQHLSRSAIKKRHPLH